MEALYRIAKKFLISVKIFGIAGLKDKDGVTSQFISVDKYSPAMCEVEVDPNIQLEFIGYADQPLKIGALDKNEFELIVRETGKNITISKQTVLFPNYFDYQRFSSNNVEQGLNILKKDFKKFNLTLIKDQMEKKGIDIDTIDQADESKLKDYEKAVAKELKLNDKDHLRAIKKINNKILKIYLHSVQSYLFNLLSSKLSDILGETIKCQIQNTDQEISFFKSYPDEIIEDFKLVELPLIGYDPSLLNRMKEQLEPLEKKYNKKLIEPLMDTIENFLKENNITFRHFILTELPQVSLEGDYRKYLAVAENFEYEQIDPETLKLIFTLTKGSYATIFTKYLMAVE